VVALEPPAQHILRETNEPLLSLPLLSRRA
jgi:hypothetical protein